MVAAAERDGWLPALPPDTIGYAVRSVIAILLALYVAFWLQLESASSAAVTAGILAQPSRGMVLSKAANRLAGTLVGAVVSVALVANFGQDRTLLLASFALWIGLCTAVGTLLRDFRAYGAVLAGYTVGIVALADINVPQDVFLTAISRVAVVTTGIVSVALVNAAFAPFGARDNLLEQMRSVLRQVQRLALDALEGAGAAVDVEASVALAETLVTLRTPIDYATAELEDGASRADAARSAAAALLTVISCGRAIASCGDALRSPHFRPIAAAASSALRGGDAAAVPRLIEARTASGPITPWEAVLAERTGEMLGQFRLAERELRVLEEGGQPARRVVLPQHLDYFAAGLNAVRAIITVAGAEIFLVLAGWPGAAFVLIQISALCALISLMPNPTRGSIGMLLGFLPVVPAALVCGFLILPGVSGFPVLAITMGVPLFLAAAAVKFPQTATYGLTFLTFFPVLLSPANPQDYDASTFANNALQLIVSGVMPVVGFWLILPVVPRRRLGRVAHAIVRDARRAQLGQVRDQASREALRYDRMRQARSWLGRRTPSRRRLLAQLLATSDLTGALARAGAALGELGDAVPREVRAAIAAPGQRCGAWAAARALLALEPRRPAALRAASALAQAAGLIERHGRFLRRAGALEAA